VNEVLSLIVEKIANMIRPILAVMAVLISPVVLWGQDRNESVKTGPVGAQQIQSGSIQESSTSTDFFIMLGSDFDRPGLASKANYNIGIGHTFGFLKKNPVGDELTLAYTYEDAGSGFWHSQFGSHTESAGVMKNFGIPKIKSITGYTWIQLGITTLTGSSILQNHLYNGESLGAIVHFNIHSSIWIQESFNKVVTIPWYTTTSIGYTWSW
jgi:hypothetical protein